MAVDVKLNVVVVVVRRLLARDIVHSTVNPHVSSTAQTSFSMNFSYDSYGGITSLLKLKKTVGILQER